MLVSLIKKKKRKKGQSVKFPKARLHGALPLDDHMSVSGAATSDTQPALMRSEAGGRETAIPGV